MTPRLILFASLAFFWWLLKRDIARREGLSRAIWIPTLWMGIIASRNLSAWVGFGGATDTLEGSPVDRLFFFAMIVAAVVVLARRRFSWSWLISANWPVFLFYGYMLVSVLWADTSFVSFKRWFKEFGNIPVAMVILTEANPMEAFRAVFARCAYVLMPLSVVFIRYFPDLGRRYSMHSGQLEPIGVTFQKNSLGCMVLVCSLVLIWDWFERTRPGAQRQSRFERYLPFGFILIGAYLLHLCDSKTSMVCLMVGAAIITASRLPVLRTRIPAIGMIVLTAGLGFYFVDSVFHVREAIVGALGRDMTFTGRTDVWRELLALHTDPLIGTGFCSFWSDQRYQSKLPPWLADGRSAHNGYLETYIDGGAIAVALLALMLLWAALKINRQLATKENYALVRLAILITILVGDFSESHFGRMSPLGFLFLLAAIGTAAPTWSVARSTQSSEASSASIPEPAESEPAEVIAGT